MTPYYESGGVEIYHGDCREVLAGLPDEFVNCCVTSPPYYGLRDYGTASWVGGDPDCDHLMLRGSQGAGGDRADRTHTQRVPYRSECGRCGGLRVDKQIGLEETPGEFVNALVGVFREVRRVLRGDGTLWANIGDSYAGSWGNQGRKEKRGTQRPVNGEMIQMVHDGRYADRKTGTGRIPHGSGLKPKDLIGIPWMLAFALRADGWYLRSDIIWAKPAPMPESVEDRPTRSHEYIFLLSKSERYYYNFEAIKEPAVAAHGSGNGYKRDARLTYADQNGARGSNEPWKPTSKRTKESPSIHGNRPGRDDAGGACNSPDQITRNKRDVWFINSQPLPDAHFATFPEALIRPCILAGCAPGGVVLDPFAGAGTTMKVARDLGCEGIGVELKAEYIEIAARRLSQQVLEFTA